MECRSKTLKTYETENWERGVLSAGHSLAFARNIEPLGAIVSTLEAEALVAHERISLLKNA